MKKFVLPIILVASLQAAVTVTDRAIEDYLTLHDEQWSGMTAQQRHARLDAFRQDEQVFEDILVVLKDEQMEDAEKQTAFITLFDRLYDKSHRIEAGTVIASIVSFTQGDLQKALLGYVTNHGVQTNRIPGEILGDTYYPRKPSTMDRAKYRMVTWFKNTRDSLTDRALDLAERATNVYEQIRGEKVD